MAQNIEVESERDRMKRKARMEESRRYVTAMLRIEDMAEVQTEPETANHAHLVTQVQQVISSYVNALRERQSSARHTIIYACGTEVTGTGMLPWLCPRHGQGCRVVDSGTAAPALGERQGTSNDPHQPAGTAGRFADAGLPGDNAMWSRLDREIAAARRSTALPQLYERQWLCGHTMIGTISTLPWSCPRTPLVDGRHHCVPTHTNPVAQETSPTQPGRR